MVLRVTSVFPRHYFGEYFGEEVDGTASRYVLQFAWTRTNDFESRIGFALAHFLHDYEKTNVHLTNFQFKASCRGSVSEINFNEMAIDFFS